MEHKARLLNSKEVGKAIIRIAHEIIERNDEIENVVLVGIKSRGKPIADKISDAIFAAAEVRVPVGELDITISKEKGDDEPVVNNESIGFSTDGKIVVLVDDVIFTGKTIWAAMQTVLKQGKVLAIQLAVLVDREHRELPIRPDYVGRNVPTSRSEIVVVSIPPYDKDQCVDIYEL